MSADPAAAAAASRAAARRRGKIEGTTEGHGLGESRDDGLNDYIARACDLPVLPRERQVQLLHQARRGNSAAREQLILHNMRLVVSVAKKFRGRGVPFADLVQEGSIGLARAVDKWQPERGALTTVGVWWIRKQIQTSIASTGEAIRIPTHVQDRRASVVKYLRDNPGATREQVAAAVGCDVAQVDVALAVAEVVASLQAEVNTKEEGAAAEALAALLSDPHADDPADYAVRTDPAVSAALAGLPPEQRRIIELRYGLGAHAAVGPLSFPEIGDVVGLPRDQVSKRHALGMAKLRKRLEQGMMTADVGEVGEGRAVLTRGHADPSTADAPPARPLNPLAHVTEDTDVVEGA